MKNEFLNKIQKLLQKAESAKEIGSLEEAEIFMAKVNKLLIKYNVSLSEIKNVNEEESIEFNRKDTIDVAPKNKTEGRWTENLLEVLAYANFCQVVYYTKRNYNTDTFKFEYTRTHILIGTPTNIEVTKYMFNFVKHLGPQLANKKYSEKVESIRSTFKVNANSQEMAIREMLFKFPELGHLTKNDIMPTSYREEDKTKFQIWMLKNVKAAGLSDRGVSTRSFLLGISDGLRLKFNEAKKEIRNLPTG